MARKKVKYGQALQQPESPKQRDGICEKCGNGGFQLRIKNHILIRICKKCGDEVVMD